MDRAGVANRVMESPAKMTVLELGPRAPRNCGQAFIPKCIFLGRGT